MKTLYVGVQKGGVGKSMMTCQMAFYARSIGYRVLVIDFDDQANTTKCLSRSGRVTHLDKTVTKVMTEFDPNLTPDGTGFNLLASDGQINKRINERARVKVEVDGGQLEEYQLVHQNFTNFIERMKQHFDLCIIDAPRSADSLVINALTIADAAICPIELAQESIEIMNDTLRSERGILNIQTAYNPNLKLLGFIPNKVQNTDKQKQNMKELIVRIGKYFFTTNDGVIPIIPQRLAIVECQKQGISIADLAKTNTMARNTWPILKKIFDAIFERIGLEDSQALANEAQIVN